MRRSVKPMPIVGCGPATAEGVGMAIKKRAAAYVTQNDELDDLLDERRDDHNFVAALEDAEARTGLVQFFANLRREWGWSQKDLAMRIKTTQSAVSDFEKGVVEPRLQTLQ